MLRRGIRYACSDMSTFFEDVKAVRPTALMLIPRIANMVHDQAQERLRKGEGNGKQVSRPRLTSLLGLTDRRRRTWLTK